MYEDPGDACTLCHPEQRVEMLARAVHAARRHESEEVKRLRGSRRPDRLEQNRVSVEGAAADLEVDPGQVLVHDAASAQVEVADLRVPLLADGQAHRFAGRGQRAVWPARPERVPGRFSGRRDRVAEGISAVTPTVDDDKD